MAPVKPKHHHQHRHHKSHKEEAQEPIIPSDVTETVQEITDGLKMVFDDSVKRVKGVADTGVIAFLMSVLVGTLFAVFLTVTAGILLVAGFILTPILAFTAFISFLATSSLVGLFLASRLYVCVNKAGLSNIAGGILDWIEETRLRIFLGLGLSAGGPSSHKGLPAAHDETLVVARVIATTTRENEDREEDEQTRIGNQESPSQVMLELLEVRGRVPLSDVSVLQDRIDINVAPPSTASSDPVQGSSASSATEELLDRDVDSRIAREGGA
ncbi:hypothetical protein QFC21_001922 [Naganishia friedmannii]|uniref:Uncharacterized protein n=1 Tax=Naganishia friedmannii TaxID=89922 RepID=A0ACC2VZY5_9TREE|nr:hypothetical protein QFC21_001922 [Naganishia friedmannii]